LGDSYAWGEGVAVDEAEAIRLYELAADSGDTVAKTSLAHMLYYGKGTVQDRQKAFSLQLESANDGYSVAMHSIGRQYFEGEGVEKNHDQARYWFEKAALEGSIPESGIFAANMCVEGLGGKVDVDRAIEILSKYAPSHELSRDLLTKVYRLRR